MRKRHKKRKKNDDEVIITCPQCDHKHKFESLEVLGKVDVTTPCENCGFLFLSQVTNRLEVMTKLLQTDPKAVKLLQDENFDRFEKYMKDKTGFEKFR